jgi:serine/threonine-protein kinase RsbW
MATGTPRPDAPTSPALLPGLRWRRVFPGEERQLAALRRWLSSLLPACPARDDVLGVASELGSNAIQHTDSGRDGGWFAVEVTWHQSVVQVAVADCGGAAEPRVIEDPAGERGRGLLLVQGLSLRAGFTGDRRGRLAWAHIAWDNPAAAGHPPSRDPYQAAIRDGEATLARSFAGVPAWFGRSTLRWWAVAGSRGLVSAPTAGELAGLLIRLLDTPDPAGFPSTRQPRPGRGGKQAAPQPRRPAPDADPDTARRRPGSASAAIRHHGAADGREHGRPARSRHPGPGSGLAAGETPLGKAS